ncbi:MAG: hypothetical protein SNJ53_08485 [Thermodesulfovibrionales bacterium]
MPNYPNHPCVDQILAVKQDHTPLNPLLIEGNLQEDSILDKVAITEELPSNKKRETFFELPSNERHSSDLPSNKRGQGVCLDTDTSAFERQIDEMVC